MNRAHPFMLIVPAFLVLAATVEGLCLQLRNGSYDWKAYLASAGDLIIRLAIGVLPLGLAATALAANLFYQFWLHATWIPRLGPLEWLLNTRSHHRVHHGSNPVSIALREWVAMFRDVLRSRSLQEALRALLDMRVTR